MQRLLRAWALVVVLVVVTVISAHASIRSGGTWQAPDTTQSRGGEDLMV